MDLGSCQPCPFNFWRLTWYSIHCYYVVVGCCHRKLFSFASHLFRRVPRTYMKSIEPIERFTSDSRPPSYHPTIFQPINVQSSHCSTSAFSRAPEPHPYIVLHPSHYVAETSLDGPRWTPKLRQVSGRYGSGPPRGLAALTEERSIAHAECLFTILGSEPSSSQP